MNKSCQIVEAARVYLDQEKGVQFIVKCVFCEQTYPLWDLFLEHLEADHIVWSNKPEENTVLPKSCSKSITELDYDMDVIETSDNEDDEELFEMKQEVEEELVSIDQQTQQETTYNKDTPSHNKSVVNIVERVKYRERDCFAELKVIPKSQSPECTEEDSDTGSPDKLEVTTEESEVELEDAMPAKQGLTDANTTAKNKLSPKTGNAIFYTLKKTDPAIMLDFIDLIKCHECQWKHSHMDYADREKRAESARLIGAKLNARWHLTMSAQMARQSVLSLRRWYELEYLRRKRNPKYRSKHAAYYERLHTFMPHAHLCALMCDECPRRFRTESCLLQHKHIAHNAGLPHKCRYCGRGFLHTSVLLNHENRHTKEQSWLCQQCGHRALSKSDYRVHLASHSTARAYVCNICGFSYKSSTSLAVHRRTHQAPTLQCDLCQKTFFENYRLKRHIMLHHRAYERHVFAYICHVCRKTFNKENELRLHEQVHFTGSLNNKVENEDVLCQEKELETLMASCVEVRFECDNCGEDFPNKKQLHAHTCETL